MCAQALLGSLVQDSTLLSLVDNLTAQTKPTRHRTMEEERLRLLLSGMERHMVKKGH